MKNPTLSDLKLFIYNTYIGIPKKSDETISLLIRLYGF